MKAIRKHLKDQIGTPGPHPFMFCPVCHDQCSANAGDYWDVPDDHVFQCCGVDMILCIEQTTITEVEP